MANITYAEGKLALVGDWKSEDLKTFHRILGIWEGFSEFNMSCGRLTIGSPVTTFSGTGRWGFAAMLAIEYDAWTRDVISKNAQKSSSAKLTAEEYDDFLNCMKQRDLKIALAFTDDDEAGYKSKFRGFILVDSDGRLTFREDEKAAIRAPRQKENVVIPDGTTEIEDGTYDGWSKMKSVKIPDSVTGIGEYAFSGCTGLTDIKIPDSVKIIGEGAFSGCTGLTDIKIPDSVTNIGKFAFSGCAGLADREGFVVVRGVLYSYRGESKDVIIPNGVTRIEERVFYWNRNISTIIIPNGVTEIGDSCFEGCYNLTSVDIPDSTTTLGKRVFANCSSLRSIIAPHLPYAAVSSKKQQMVVGFAIAMEQGRVISDKERASYLGYIKRNSEELYDIAVKEPALLRLMLSEKLIPDNAAGR